MKFIGYLVALLGLYIIYDGGVFLGGVVFVIGGYVAQKMSIQFRSAGLVLFVTSLG